MSNPKIQTKTDLGYNSESQPTSPDVKPRGRRKKTLLRISVVKKSLQQNLEDLCIDLSKIEPADGDSNTIQTPTEQKPIVPIHSLHKRLEEIRSSRAVSRQSSKKSIMSRNSSISDPDYVHLTPKSQKSAKKTDSVKGDGSESENEGSAKMKTPKKVEKTGSFRGSATPKSSERYQDPKLKTPAPQASTFNKKIRMNLNDMTSDELIEVSIHKNYD